MRSLTLHNTNAHRIYGTTIVWSHWPIQYTNALRSDGAKVTVGDWEKRLCREKGCGVPTPNSRRNPIQMGSHRDNIAWWRQYLLLLHIFNKCQIANSATDDCTRTNIVGHTNPYNSAQNDSKITKICGSFNPRRRAMPLLEEKWHGNTMRRQGEMMEEKEEKNRFNVNVNYNQYIGLTLIICWKHFQWFRVTALKWRCCRRTWRNASTLTTHCCSWNAHRAH